MISIFAKATMDKLFRKFKFNIIYKYIFVALAVVLVAQVSFSFYLADVELKYSDVDEFDKFFPSIVYFTERGVVDGYPDGHFGSGEEVNRVEALKMILLASGLEILEEKPASEDLQYKDIDVEQWYAPFVFQATELGIIEGYPDGNFYPDNTVNLAEAVKMIFYANDLANLPKPRENPADDVPKDEWYADEFYYAIARDVVWPSIEWKVYPDKNLTRGEVLELLYKFLLRDEEKEITYTGKATYYADYFNGKSTASGAVFDQELYTAAHRFFDFGTILTVVNLENGATVEVTVNDRGPYVDGYSLDLTSTAFETISPLSRGVIDIFYFVSE
jgi:rare lipoprotein A